MLSERFKCAQSTSLPNIRLTLQNYHPSTCRMNWTIRIRDCMIDVAIQRFPFLNHLDLSPQSLASLFFWLSN